MGLPPGPPQENEATTSLDGYFSGLYFPEHLANFHAMKQLQAAGEDVDFNDPAVLFLQAALGKRMGRSIPRKELEKAMRHCPAAAEWGDLEDSKQERSFFGTIETARERVEASLGTVFHLGDGYVMAELGELVSPDCLTENFLAELIVWTLKKMGVEDIEAGFNEHIGGWPAKRFKILNWRFKPPTREAVQAACLQIISEAAAVTAAAPEPEPESAPTAPYPAPEEPAPVAAVGPEPVSASVPDDPAPISDPEPENPNKEIYWNINQLMAAAGLIPGCEAPEMAAGIGIGWVRGHVSNLNQLMPKMPQADLDDLVAKNQALQRGEFMVNDVKVTFDKKTRHFRCYVPLDAEEMAHAEEAIAQLEGAVACEISGINAGWVNSKTTILRSRLQRMSDEELAGFLADHPILLSDFEVYNFRISFDREERMLHAHNLENERRAQMSTPAYHFDQLVRASLADKVEVEGYWVRGKLRIVNSMLAVMPDPEYSAFVAQRPVLQTGHFKIGPWQVAFNVKARRLYIEREEQLKDEGEDEADKAKKTMLAEQQAAARAASRDGRARAARELRERTNAARATRLIEGSQRLASELRAAAIEKLAKDMPEPIELERGERYQLCQPAQSLYPRVSGKSFVAILGPLDDPRYERFATLHELDKNPNLTLVRLGGTTGEIKCVDRRFIEPMLTAAPTRPRPRRAPSTSDGPTLEPFRISGEVREIMARIDAACDGTPIWKWRNTGGNAKLKDDPDEDAEESSADDLDDDEEVTGEKWGA